MHLKEVFEVLLSISFQLSNFLEIALCTVPFSADLCANVMHAICGGKILSAGSHIQSHPPPPTKSERQILEAQLLHLQGFLSSY